MKHTTFDREYQQSSRDASEEDAADNDSIASVYDSCTEPSTFPQKENDQHRTIHNVDEGEISATTSECGVVPKETSRRGSEAKAVDMVDKRYVDVTAMASTKVANPPSDRPARIYSDGIYDLFHLG